jgi:hypothetical protein
MNSLLVATKASPPSEGEPARRRVRWRRPPAWTLVVLCYLLAAIAMTWRVWAAPHVNVPSASNVAENDIYLNIWFMRYIAVAVAHGHLPALVTNTLNAPQGVNLMWNTSLLLPGVVLAPLTLTAGPVVSLAVLLTLGFAGSAIAMFAVLRNWGASPIAAGLGGAFYAFLPALVVAAEDHYHLEFAVFPPLIIDAVARLLTGRGRPVLVGLWLGLLLALQLFVAEELLVDTALVAVVLTLFLVLARPAAIILIMPRAAARRGARILLGSAVAAVVALVLCGRALWVQFHGPLTEHGSPWHLGKYGNHIGTFVTAPNTVLIHNNFSIFLAVTFQHPIEVYGYLGWPLLVALIVLPIIFWRDVRVRVLGLTFFAIEWLSMGGHRQRLGRFNISANALAWHYLWHLPILSQVVPNRLSILADGLAAAVLAFSAEHVISALRRQHSWRSWRRITIAAVATAALAAIVVPVLPRAVPAAPVSAAPAGWHAVIRRLHLPYDASVLVLPFGGGLPMSWQALSRQPIALVGGYCIAPDPEGFATKCDNAPMENPPERTVELRASTLADIPDTKGPNYDTLALALLGWHPGALVAAPALEPGLVSYLIEKLGRPTAAAGGFVGWRLDRQWYRRAKARVAFNESQPPKPKHPPAHGASTPRPRRSPKPV